MVVRMSFFIRENHVLVKRWWYIRNISVTKIIALSYFELWSKFSFTHLKAFVNETNCKLNFFFFFWLQRGSMARKGRNYITTSWGVVFFFFFGEAQPRSNYLKHISFDKCLNWDKYVSNNTTLESIEAFF